MSEQAPFYIFTAFVLAYGTEDLGFSKDFAAQRDAGRRGAGAGQRPVLRATCPTGSGASGCTCIGAVADRAVRRSRTSALLDTESAALVLLAIVVSLIPHDMQYGPQAALIAESFPTRLRYSGAGLGYQLASVIAGGPAPLIADLAAAHVRQLAADRALHRWPAPS